MKKYFSQLRPLERRLVVGVLVVLFVVLNLVFVRPYFSQWGTMRDRLTDAQGKLKRYQAMSAQKPTLEKQVKVYESQGGFVAPEDQAVNLMRTIQGQAANSGFGIQNFSRSQMRTNQFFTEQTQNITVLATEEQLVDFLFKLGSGASMIRVFDLEMQPDQPRQHLQANIKLIASFQKNPATTNAATISNAKAK
jgi:Tfp pilus assembly protein PilO